MSTAKSTPIEAAAGFILAVVLGILGALALIHWATPCEGASLCGAGMLVTPTRTGWLQRQWLRWRALRLRASIRMAEADLNIHKLDLAVAQEELEYLPGLIAWQQGHITRQRNELADAQAAL